MYLDKFEFDYELLNNCDQKPGEAINGFDGIMYNQSDITEAHYLEFAEYYFADDMTHLKILNILENDEFSDEQIKLVNDYAKSKTVLNKVFNKTKFDGNNKNFFINAINENKSEIIKSIFRNGKNLYADYCNTNLLLTTDNPHCRLVGYNVDKGRKTKFLGFGFSASSFVGNDILEFDFIPFAFSKTYESYFINNNFDVKSLCATARTLNEELSKLENKNPRSSLLTILKNAKDFIYFDVEIITKSRDEECFKTLFVRYDRLKALQNIPEYALNFKYKLNEKYWLNLEEEVYSDCINGVMLDSLIELMLKIYFDDNVNKFYIKSKTEILININESWEGNRLTKEIESAKKMGYIVSQELIRQKKENKINSYKQKIIGAIVAHDYDRVNEVILSLSAYVGMEFNFAYPLFENPEDNKNIAFTFANALSDTNKKAE